MAFADFIAPFDARSFCSDYFGKRPVHMPANAGRHVDVLDWPRFNRALALAPYWNEETLKVYYKSRAALRENYCDLSDAKPGLPAPINPAKVKSLLGLGASLIANQIHKVCPEIARITGILEEQFAARVWANVYCSFKGVQAFQTHFDLHDVFAYQAEGEKTWRVYEARADAPIAPLPPGDEVEKWLQSSRGRLLFEVKMRPGDILYLPRGQYHDALTGASASLHVTFGVAPANGLALFKLLESILTPESQFRAYLPDAREETALRQSLVQLAERVRTVMLSPAFGLDVRAMQARLARSTTDYGLPEQPAPSWFSLAKPARLLRNDRGYFVSCESGEFPLADAHIALEWVLGQRLFSLEDALAQQGGLDRATFLVELQKLIDRGIVVPTDMR
ncbi:MAG: cupin domain-containing protein [Steroidobacteraceae bacterium]